MQNRVTMMMIEKERKGREVELLVNLKRRLEDRLKSAAGQRELEEIAKEKAADSEAGEGLDNETHGEERKSIEVEDGKMRVGKREIPDSADEGEEKEKEDAVSIPKAKRRKISAQQFSPAIPNHLQHDDHLSS